MSIDIAQDFKDYAILHEDTLNARILEILNTFRSEDSIRNIMTIINDLFGSKEFVQALTDENVKGILVDIEFGVKKAIALFVQVFDLYYHGEIKDLNPLIVAESHTQKNQV